MQIILLNIDVNIDHIRTYGNFNRGSDEPYRRLTYEGSQTGAWWLNEVKPQLLFWGTPTNPTTTSVVLGRCPFAPGTRGAEETDRGFRG